MKAILTTIVAILFSGVIWGQEIDRTSFLHKSKSMGLVAYLTHIKYDAEFKMAILVNHPEYEKQKNKAEQMNANYNLLKLSVDKLVNQMSADLYNRNFLKLYRETDDFVKTKKN